MDGENRKWENGLTFEILETFSSFSHNLKISDKDWLPVNSTYFNYVDLNPTHSGKIEKVAKLREVPKIELKSAEIQKKPESSGAYEIIFSGIMSFLLFL